MHKFCTVFVVCLALCVGYSSAEPTECVICDSSVDKNCAQKPDSIATQKCAATQADDVKCFTRIVNGVTYRGCFQELDQGYQQKCLNDNLGVNCTVCENVNGSRGCNQGVFPALRLTCHICEGDLNSNCFKSPTGNAVACPKYDPEDKCYTRKTTKQIQRGCMSDTSKCSNPDHCHICDGQGCNNLFGNSTTIPTAPNSAANWASTMTTVFVAAIVCLKITS